MKKNTHGFVLPLAMIIVFAISALVIRLMKEVTIAAPMGRMVEDRELAKVIAWMGIDLAIAQLGHDLKDEKSLKAFYERFFGMLNTWKVQELRVEQDGIDGQIMTYVSCEDGKIPINALWDFKAKKFVTRGKLDVKQLFENVNLQKKDKGKTKDRPLLEGLESFFKTQKYPLEDVTSLFTEESFQGLLQPLFTQPVPKKDESPVFTPVIGDLLTTAQNELVINPCFLSVTVGEIFGLKKDGFNDEKKREQLVKKLSQIKGNAIDWSKQWNDILAPIYNKKYDSLPISLREIFSNAIGASVISVVCYGKVGMITQKIRAELIADVESENRVKYKIRKFYWL